MPCDTLVQAHGLHPELLQENRLVVHTQHCVTPITEW